MKKILCILFSILLFTFSWTAIACKSVDRTEDDSISVKVDKLFSEWDKPGSPGASLAVIKDGSVVYKKGYGYAHLEYDIPITPSTVFHVASVSKQFTAFAITMLADQGKLSLDDDVHKHLPEIPDFGKTITIRHLIHHISGLRDQWELLAMAGWRLDDVITKEHILKMMRNQRDLNFEPGAEYLYCNTGYTLMAEIVSRIAGKSFSEWTEENIFNPLGMSSTQFYDDHERIVKNRAYSYSPVKDKGFRKRRLNYANVGATSLFTTAEDIAKWVNNFEDGRVGGTDVIEQMHEQGVLNDGKKIVYAFGLSIGRHKGLKIVSHSGGDAGYRSHVIRFPEQKFAVVVLSNLGSMNPSRLARQVADIYLSDKISQEESKAEQKGAKVDPTIYDGYVGKYYIEPGFVITITKEKNQLISQINDRPKVELVPESEIDFVLKGRDGKLTFHLNNIGKAIKLTFRIDGEALEGDKFKPFISNVQQLTEFAGDYYSHELGTTYTMVIQDGKLVAKHRRHNDIKLSPTKEDMFQGEQWFFRQVRFTRNINKQITGFELSGGRVTNLRFDKQ